MKKIQRVKRPPRAIKLRHREAAKTASHAVAAMKPKAPSLRQSMITYDGLLNEVAAAARAGKSISTLQNRRSQGLPPKFERRGRNIFYRIADLDEVWGSQG